MAYFKEYRFRLKKPWSVQAETVPTGEADRQLEQKKREIDEYIEEEKGGDRMEPRKVSCTLLTKGSFFTLCGNKSLDEEKK